MTPPIGNNPQDLDMPPTTFSQTSLTTSGRNCDKPYVSIDVEIHNDHQIQSGHYERDQRLAMGGSSIDESKRKDVKTNHVSFLGFDLHHFSSTSQFCILSAGIFFFYLLYGITMEQIFRLPGLYTLKILGVKNWA